MSRSIEGHLILGWEVEVGDAENYNDDLTEEANERIDEILGKGFFDRDCDPYIFWSLYCYCDYMWVGLELMNRFNEFSDVGDYGKFLAANAELLTKTACDIYEAVMGKPAECGPTLMCVGSEG